MGGVVRVRGIFSFLIYFWSCTAMTKKRQMIGCTRLCVFCFVLTTTSCAMLPFCRPLFFSPPFCFSSSSSSSSSFLPHGFSGNYFNSPLPTYITLLSTLKISLNRLKQNIFACDFFILSLSLILHNFYTQKWKYFPLAVHGRRNFFQRLTLWNRFLFHDPYFFPIWLPNGLLQNLNPSIELVENILKK